MNTQEQLEWKISIAREIKDELLNRGSASIRGVLDRKIMGLTRDLIVEKAKENLESVPAVEG